MATTTPKPLTVEDLYSMDSGVVEHELARGALIEMPPSGFESSEVSLSLGAEIRSFARLHNLGRVSGEQGGYILSRNPDTVLVPDVGFVRSDRLPEARSRRGFLELAPDLVVEVVSPSDRWMKVNDKVLAWLDAGVRLVWVVDPIGQSVTVWTPDRASKVLTGSDTLTGGDVLPGFELPVQRIFE